MIKKYLKHDMVKNFSIVLIGGVIAQGISALTPIVLTRFFTPEQFGVVSLITATVSIIGAFSNLDYIATINIADNTKDSYRLLQLSKLIGLLVVVLSAVVILFLYYLPYQNKVQEFGLDIALCIPLWVFFYNFFYTSREYLSRNGQFKTLSIIGISKSIIVSSAQIIVGLISPKVIFLLIAKILGDAFASTISFFHTKDKFNISKEDYLNVLKKYKEITIYSLPTKLLEAFSRHILIFVISIYYSMTIVGLYSIAMKLIQIPVTMITENMQKVFEQRSNKYVHSNKDLLTFTLRTATLLSAIALPITLILFFWSDFIIKSFLKAEWEPVAIYLKWLSPYLFFHFINQPFNSLFRIKRKTDIHLKIQTVESLTIFGLVVISGLYFNEIQMIKLYVLGGIFFLVFKKVYMIRELRKCAD
jgi:lipopolysaccharide exporter